MPIIKQTETANQYIQILDFIKTYGHKLYNKPDRIQDDKTKNEMLMLKRRAREITSMMRDISNRAVASSNLRLSNSIRWLNGSNIYIKDYLWAKLKYPRNSSPITISIFAENNNYRIALELDDKNATSNDYEFYKKYLDLHIDTSVLKFYGKQSSSDNLQILDLTQDQVIERLRNSNKKERIQLSYFISRINEENNQSKSDEIFSRQFVEGVRLLYPYYEHVLGFYY